MSPPPQKGLVAEAVLAAKAGDSGWMRVELREPVLTPGLGVVSSVGHGGHHAMGRRLDEIRLKWLSGLLRFLPQKLEFQETSEKRKGRIAMCVPTFERIYLRRVPGQTADEE